MKILDGGRDSPRATWERQRLDDPEKIVCRVCERRSGVATSTMIPVILVPTVKNGRQIGGTKALMCAYCLAAGEVTMVWAAGR